MELEELVDKYCDYIKCKGNTLCKNCVLCDFYKTIKSGVTNVEVNDNLLHTCISCSHIHHLNDENISLYYCEECREIIDNPSTCECNRYTKE